LRLQLQEGENAFFDDTKLEELFTPVNAKTLKLIFTIHWLNSQLMLNPMNKEVMQNMVYFKKAFF